MFVDIILFIASFGLSDLFVKNKSTNFKIIYYSVMMIIGLYILFNKYIHEELLSSNRKRK